jgi:hypothetical protein
MVITEGAEQGGNMAEQPNLDKNVISSPLFPERIMIDKIVVYPNLISSRK